MSQVKNKHYKATVEKKQADIKNLWLGSAAITAVTLLIYLPVFSNGFVTLDDDRYIQQQPLIRSLDLKGVFSHYVMGNYHPLVMMIYTFIYHFSQLDPQAYHAASLLIHIANSCLVMWLLYCLVGTFPVPLVVGILFGIHPLHVESVAWASELKDLMYTFGFLLSLIYYMRFVKQKQAPRFYIFSLLFFIFSLLSKAMAVSLTMVLFQIDFYLNRRFSSKTIAEKIPFLVLSVIFGVVAIFAQQSIAAMEGIELFSFPKRVVFACYGFIIYIARILVPINLCAYYPYPDVSTDSLPVQYYVYTLLVILLLASVFYSLKKTRKIFFGMGFYAITIFLVLQLLPVGGTITADRYTYIPSIGIFFLIAEGLMYWSKRNNPSSSSFSPASKGILVVFILFLAFQTIHQLKTWKDGVTLWSNVIDHHPTVSIAYNNRGAIYKDTGEFDKAVADFTMTIRLDSKRTYAYLNRGTIFGKTGKLEDAIKDFNKVIEIDSGMAESYYMRGIAYNSMNRKSEACSDFKKAAELGYRPSVDAYRDVCN